MTYEFLIEMGWKSALIAAAGLLLATMLRSRSAADRGRVLKLCVALLLALPAVALFMPALEIETSAQSPAPTPTVAPAVTVAATYGAPMAAQASSDVPATAEDSALRSTGDWDDPSLLFLLLYAGGVAMVAGRLLAGLWTLRRWTREARDVTDPAWIEALSRSGGEARGIRLLVSEDASSPLSWGWLRPVVLIDRDTLREPQEADAILAHEVAHVTRRDWPSLLLSRLAVALFWFNPLVWRVDREMAQQAEEAADGEAAARVEPARYAQTLLDWARLSVPNALPANAIGAGEPGLSKRVRAVLDGRAMRQPGSRWAAAAMLGCAVVAAPVAAVEFVPKAPGPAALPVATRIAPAVASSIAPVLAVSPVSPMANASSVRLVRAVAEPAAPALPPEPRTVPFAPAFLAAAMAPPQRSLEPPRLMAHLRPVATRRPIVDSRAIEAEVNAAVAEAMRSVDIATAQAERAGERAARQVRAGLARGAVGMEAGAVGMERGAANMRAEAARLRDRNYREQQIRREATRGRHLTHEDLLEAAEGLEEGAGELRESAQELRESAAEMRRGHDG
jgi:beta-lactamase regulating signal transducer with metallopeptidase domain